MNSTLRSRFLLVPFLCLGQLVLAQVAAVTAMAGSTDAGTLLLDFLDQQRLLAQGYSALLQRGATPQQVQTWLAANTALFQEQQARAVTLAAYSATQPLDYVYEVTIPADATQAMDDFLMVRSSLYNSYAELYNQATASKSDMQAAFQSQHTAELQAQAQRAQVLAVGLAAQPLPIPPSLTVPAGASPLLATFLMLRDQLARQHAVLWNQYVGQPVAMRDAAIAQWQQQNQANLQQLQQLIQQLALASGN